MTCGPPAGNYVHDFTWLRRRENATVTGSAGWAPERDPASGKAPSQTGNLVTAGKTGFSLLGNRGLFPRVIVGHTHQALLGLLSCPSYSVSPASEEG